MTTEDDFQAALDANCSDWQTRLVFADWLQDRDDPRADGYRAMGRLRLSTFNVNPPPQTPLWTWFPFGPLGYSARALPRDWYELLADWYELLADGDLADRNPPWRDYLSRREADDAAALAFAELPPERQAELLAVGVGQNE